MASLICRSQPMQWNILYCSTVMYCLSVKQYKLQCVRQFCLVFLLFCVHTARSAEVDPPPDLAQSVVSG